MQRRWRGAGEGNARAADTGWSTTDARSQRQAAADVCHAECEGREDPRAAAARRQLRRRGVQPGDDGSVQHARQRHDDHVKEKSATSFEVEQNLLENACKWAKSRVTITATFDGARVVMHVDDDGAGLEPSMRDRVLGRGVRADERAPGSGFGLAIVCDLAEVYGGSVALEQSPQGGVRAQLTLPGHLTDVDG